MISPIGDARLSRWLARQLLHTRNLVRHSLGVDKPIAFTILARGWSSFAGVVTVLLIARLLSPAEQGYYYTFGSLVALQIVFELGFSFVILQMASHELAHLNLTSNDTIEGNPVSHARIASVLQKSVRWYSAAAVLLGIFLVLAGSHFFGSHQHPGVSVQWRAAWITTSIAAAITFQLDPILSFMEGCGFVANVAKVRFAQAATGSILAWTMLAAHHGLFAPAMVIAGNAIVAALWLSSHRRLLLGLLRHDTGAHRVQWFKEVWPFQWRIAISWLCGYFIYQLFNPVLFAFHGPVSAGQMGMSLNVVNALQAVAISWMNTKAAPFGGMVARKEYGLLDHVFFKSLRQSLAVFCAGALLVITCVVYLNFRHLAIASRLLSPESLAALLLSTAINLLVFGQALYLRAHKQEKFLGNSILAAILISLSTYFLGRKYGAPGIVAGNLILAIVVGLPYGTYTFVKYRKLWHAE